MGKTDANSVVEKLRKILSRVGLPKEICSDNGPPFNSFDFDSFCTDLGIKVHKSSPYHPQSNGLAEGVFKQ